MKYRSILYLILAAILGIVTFFVTTSQLKFLAAAKNAHGNVTQNIYITNEDSSSYFPIVDFTTPDKLHHTFQSSVGHTPAEYKIGEPVEVIYDPASPDTTGQINSWFASWFSALCSGVFAGVFLITGIVTLILDLKRKVL